jgi:two-component system, LytTR family, response regulator
MKNKPIFLPTANYSEIVSAKEIMYCQASGSYSEVFLQDTRKITISKNLRWLELQLQEQKFCRPHKSFLVNIRHIKKIYALEKTLHLTNGKSIPLSRRKKKEFILLISGIF